MSSDVSGKRTTRKRGRPKDSDGGHASVGKIAKISGHGGSGYDSQTSQEDADEYTMSLPLSKRLKNRLPDDPPLNKDGYRYYLAEPDRLNPESTNQELDWHGGVIPSKHYRRWWPEKVLLSQIDVASQLKINIPKQTVIGEHGYSSIRATHSITTGDWYFEVEILEMPTAAEDPVKLGQSDSACRVGWSTEKQILQTPCGYGPFGFSIRSRKGTFFNKSKGKHYSDTGFAVGDVIGCRLTLPKKNGQLTNKQFLRERFEQGAKNRKYKIHGAQDGMTGNLSTKRKSRKSKHEKASFEIDDGAISMQPMPNSLKSQSDGVLIKYKGFFYFEVPENESLSTLKNYETVPGRIEFFKNGSSLGVAYEDEVPVGEYFPTISLYRSCKVRPNFGPNFKTNLKKLPPVDLWPGGVRAMSQRPGQTIIESAISDMLDTLDGKFKKPDKSS